MAESIELNIPQSAAERADINAISQLLTWYRNGDLNNEQMIASIRHWAATAAALPRQDRGGAA